MIERSRVRIPARAAGEFSSQELILCVLQQSFCQKCRWQVTLKHAYTLDPSKSKWADYAAVQAQCGNLSGNDLTRNLSGNIRPHSSQLADTGIKSGINANIRPQSSQLAVPLWTDPGIKSEISARELISLKKKKR